MPQLINRHGPIQNRWTVLGDDQPIEDIADRPVIVPAGRWLAVRESLPGAADGIGVLLDPTSDIAELRSDLPALGLIAIHFGVFSDGRGFSQAHLLRKRYGYTGTIRAVGQVLRDQLWFMARCGIDEFELDGEEDAAAALKAFTDFSVGYQADMVRRA